MNSKTEQNSNSPTFLLFLIGLMSIYASNIRKQAERLPCGSSPDIQQNMYASPFLAFSSHSPQASKTSPLHKTPSILTVPYEPPYHNDGLANYPRPLTQKWPSQAPKPFSGITKQPNQDSRKYSPLTSVKSEKYLPLHGSQMMLTKEELGMTGSGHKFKSCKIAQNAQANEDITTKTTEARQKKASFSPLGTPNKFRKNSFNCAAQTGKQPRFSMVDEPYLQSQNYERGKKSRKAWIENSNFQIDPEAQIFEQKKGNAQPFETMYQSKTDNETIMVHIIAPKLQKERKHSDNQCIRRTPAFLLTSKSSHRSERSHSPRVKWSIERFLIIKQLGRGAYGRVVLALERESKCIFAIKILSKRDLQEENMLGQLVRQVKIQLFLQHPNIVKIYGFFDDLLHLYIIMESALDGRLQPNPLPQPQSASIFHQLCAATAYMHSQQVIHRDLKPENVMLHEGVVKVCDFGWSVYRASEMRTTFCGTPLYLSPEVLIGDSYDESIDVWALGVILFEIVFGGSPFGITRQEDLPNIINMPVNFPQQGSNQVKQIILSCLTKNSQDRPTVKWLLGQEWVRRGQPEQWRRFAV